MEHALLDALLPVVLLLALGVVAAIGSREVGLSPVVGYLGLGLIRLGMDSDAVNAWARRTKLRATVASAPGLAA